MEYRRTETGFEPLPRRNVDYGGGLERIAAAAIDTSDVFRISLLWPIIEQLQELSGRTYEDETLAMRVIADHLRGATFLAVDGVRPSNKAQGYVMRRLVRRAVRFAVDLGIEDNFFPHVIPTIAGIYSGAYPEVAAAADAVADLLAREEQVFRRTLRQRPRAAGGSPGHGRHRCRPLRALRHLRLPGRAVDGGGARGGHRRQRHVA